MVYSRTRPSVYANLTLRIILYGKRTSLLDTCGVRFWTRAAFLRKPAGSPGKASVYNHSVNPIAGNATGSGLSRGPRLKLSKEMSHY